MRILADENLSGAFVRWLRNAGHDVVWIAESAPGISDDAVLAETERDQRVLLTFDRDHGELIFRHGAACPGVVLFRLEGVAETDRLNVFSSIWPVIEGRISGHFVVVTPDRFRIRPLPRARF